MGPTAILSATGTTSVSFTADTPQDWRLIFAHVSYVAAAVAGSRTIVMELLNGSGVVVGDWHCTPAITSGQTRDVEFMAGTYREATFDANNTVQVPFPIGLIIPDGYSLRLRASAGGNAGDSLAAYIQVEKGPAL